MQHSLCYAALHHKANTFLQEKAMSSNLFTNPFEQSYPLLDTVARVNRLGVAELEKLVTLQMSTLASYVDFSLGQMKAASEISDPKSLQAFYTQQMEALNTLRQKVLDDSQALAKLAADFREEFAKLVEENVIELVPKAAKPEAREAA
jgi:phasin family protein